MARGIEPPKRLDISYADYAFALRCCGTASERHRDAVEAAVEALWAPEHGDALTALSVRTAFDAFLGVLRLPQRAEVLMSAVTIPDMVKIVEGHGLVPVAIDIGYDTLAPRLDLMEKALNSRTKVVVVSHVFGSISPMGPIIDWAHENGLLVVEDCAEAYCGPRYRGHERADLSLFSFGTIKTETALGGALLRVADAGLREAMRATMAHYAVQPLSVFSKRVAKYMAFSAVLNQPRLYAAFVKGVSAAGGDHLDVLLANSRGFAGQDLFQGIRLRPPVALLKLLQRRIETFDAARLERRRVVCAKVAAEIRKIERVCVPGKLADPHWYWLFPINVDDPDTVSKVLLEEGFDATAGTTSLMSVDAVVTERSKSYRSVFSAEGAGASKIMSNILYLPLDADTPADKVEHLVRCLRSAVGAKGPRL